MSVVEMSRHQAGVSLGQVVARLTAMITTWNEVRATRRELNALSDHALADIGLVRADIEQVSRAV